MKSAGSWQGNINESRYIDVRKVSRYMDRY